MSNPKFTLLIKGGLLILATSTWADVGRTIIETYYPYGKQGIIAKVLYAIIVTIIVILMVTLLHYTVNFGEKITENVKVNVNPVGHKKNT